MTVDYARLQSQFEALADTDNDTLAMSANFVALIYSEMPDVNWLGLYVTRGNELVLGPFQGLPACIRIPFGQGVCGTAAQEAMTQRIADVHAFEGHIACDPASNSELVVPLIDDRDVIGVLDIDSPLTGRFSAGDQAGIEALCASFVNRLSPDASASCGFI